MSDEKGGPHDRPEGERQEAHDEAPASVQDSNSPHVEHTALEGARDSEPERRPPLSPQLPTHEKAHDSEKSSPQPQPPPHNEARESAEKPPLGPQPSTHEEAHEFLDRPSRSSQSPMHEEADSSEKLSHSSQPPAHEQEQHASVKGFRISKRNARSVRAKQQREERKRATQEERRLENERRLEGQRLEYERKVEARRKAEEAASAARAQSEGEKRSTNGEEPQRLSGSEEAQRVGQRRQQQRLLMEESVKAECREDAEGGSPTAAIKMDDDQKVHNDDDPKTVGALGPRVLEHDTGATYLAITDDEHSKSHFTMMAQSASTRFLAPPSPPITPCDPYDPASSHSGLGYYYYGKDDVTHQCHYWCQCGLVREDLREDSQTGMESNYLFEPPLLRLPSPKPVSVQTRQEATDVLFQESGDVGTAAVITVIVPRVKTQYYFRDNGVSTTRDITHDFQKGRRATRQGGSGGFRSRGRGGRGPRDGPDK